MVTAVGGRPTWPHVVIIIDVVLDYRRLLAVALNRAVDWFDRVINVLIVMDGLGAIVNPRRVLIDL